MTFTGFQPPKPPPPPPPPLAFDVPINDENVIKKLPPKRFRRFPSQQVENSRGLTREELNGKLQDAEIRRRLILSQRIQSAQQKIVQNKKLTHSDALSRKVSRAYLCHVLKPFKLIVRVTLKQI